jgi:hypothetical protein
VGRTLRAGIAVAVAVLALAGTAAAAWAARTSFGADLSAEANDPAICGEGFFPSLSPSSSCTWFSGAPGASFYAPASGTVTAVRVRAGAVGGAMQVVVMRSLYENKEGDPEHPYFTCCFIEGYGPVFEAKANAVTSVASALAMTEEPTPPPRDVTTKAAGDFLAISVLAPNVPIPAFIDERSNDGGFYPSPTPKTLPAPGAGPLSASASTEGAEMLMNADLETQAETAPTGIGPASPPGSGVVPGVALNRFALARRPAAAVALAQVAIVVHGGLATIPLQCLALDCAGSLSLQSARAALVARVKRRHAKAISYGTTHFSLKAGMRGKIKVKLSAAARKLLKRRHRLSVWANVRFTSGGAAPSSVRITLRR